MAFRRSPLIDPVTSRWRTLHRQQLSQWLPDSVLGSDRALNYVLLHGRELPGSGWSAEQLSPSAARAFLQFLETTLPHSTGYDLCLVLRRLAAASPIIKPDQPDR